MWVSSSRMYLGAPDTADAGKAFLDKILTEGRIAPVAAFARGEITESEFQILMCSQRIGSIPGKTPAGIKIARLPVQGTALEIWVAATFLSSELKTLLGKWTLIPLVDAWDECRFRLNMPAIGATGIGVGAAKDSVRFKEFGKSPAELGTRYFDKRVLIPPAVGIEAGVVGNFKALENLENTVDVLEDSGRFSVIWGMPNYIDIGRTMLVDEDDPLRGTLEIAQMAVAIMNQILGGDFLENLLRKNQGWDNAINSYTKFLNTRAIEWEAESNPRGSGSRQLRGSKARKNYTWRMNERNTSVEYDIALDCAGEYHLCIRYSNDDLQDITEIITVAVNDSVVGTFETVDTKRPRQSGGDGWFNFISSPPIPLGKLFGDTITIALRLDNTLSFGIEFDALSLYSTNNPPIICNSISDLELRVDEEITYNLNEVFIDVDGDNLVFSAMSSDTNLVKVSISNEILTIKAVQPSGEATITIFADDQQTCMESLSFIAQVVPSTSVELLDDMLPRAFSLKQNYPNPFNAATVVQFDLPHTSHVTITIYNILGVEVTTLVNKKMPAGRYSINWSAGNLASGIYLYRFTAGNYKKTRRLMLLK